MTIKERLDEYKIAFWYYKNRFHPINQHKAVFCNYNGKGFGCNPKYIALEMLKRNPGWDIVWVVKEDKYKFPKGIRTVKWDSKEAIYELATAVVWVDNQRKLWYHRKRKKQFFIETWHGGAETLKKIGADNPANFDNKPYEHTSHHMNRIVNIMVSNGKLCNEIYKSAFLYNGKILECGSPRNDILVNCPKNFEAKVKNFFNIPHNAHIVIYAPTYRNGRKTDKMQLDGHKMLDALSGKFGGDWYMLKRLHPTMAQSASGLDYGGNIINASEYDDMQELLAASDVLVSDYSSVIGEFSIMKKPVFLYAEDISDYSRERDFYVDYFGLPYLIAEDEDKLVENILLFNQEIYERKVRDYHKKIGSVEKGTASESVVDAIYKHIEEEFS